MTESVGRSVGLGKSHRIGAEEPSELRSELKEKMPPGAPVVGPKDLALLLVHFEICGEEGLGGEEPGGAPEPPLPEGGASVVSHGGEGVGSGE